MVEGRNLAATDKKGHCNPYIKLYLLPDLKTSKRKTKVDKRTCNPLYNQTFEVHVTMRDYRSRMFCKHKT